MFNEEIVLPQLVSRLDALFEYNEANVDVVFVNDGSSDNTPKLIEEYAKERPYKLVNLSRNFGHQIAITAGVAEAQGDAIVIMDADLQDPPEVAVDMINAWRNGYDVVSAKRARREGEGLFKRWTASLYYRLLAKMTPIDIPRDVGDFRLIDRKVADALNAMPEQDRYFRGMVSWFLGGDTVPGWASTMLLLSFLSGVQLLTLGIIGLYVGRIYNEVKGRPLYLVDPEKSDEANIEIAEDKQD